MPPSEYFKRQCFVSVECDEVPVKHIIDAIGDDQHRLLDGFSARRLEVSRGRWSRSSELPISEESKRKILWDNCAAYYGLPS